MPDSLDRRVPLSKRTARRRGALLARLRTGGCEATNDPVRMRYAVHPPRRVKAASVRRTGKSAPTRVGRRGLQGAAAAVLSLGCSLEAPVVEREAAVDEREERREAAPSPSPGREIRLPAAHVPTAAPEERAPEERAPEEPAPEPARPAGPRTVPPGTPPAIARVFERLPVGIHDEPPVGAIGATGIHVDKIWLGQAYEREGCKGESERFSLAKHGQVNVCFRVVHSRVEESVDVLWEKDGELFRRRPVQIPDLHAYRTRAYLVLRREYIGNWRARVMSVDGMELAVASFVVVE